MTTRRDPQKEARWRRVAHQAVGGLTIAEWRRRRGYSESLFHYWKGALAKRDRRPVEPPWGRAKTVAARQAIAPHQTKTAATGRAVVNDPSQAVTAGFARVGPAAPAEKSRLTTPSASAAGSLIEIALPGERAPRVGVGFDAATLARALEVLEERSR